MYNQRYSIFNWDKLSHTRKQIIRQCMALKQDFLTFFPRLDIHSKTRFSCPFSIDRSYFEVRKRKVGFFTDTLLGLPVLIKVYKKSDQTGFTGDFQTGLNPALLCVK